MTKKEYVFLGYYSTGKVDDAKVILKNKDKTIFEKHCYFSDKPYAESIKIEGAYNLTDLYTVNQ